MVLFNRILYYEVVYHHVREFSLFLGCFLLIHSVALLHNQLSHLELMFVGNRFFFMYDHIFQILFSLVLRRVYFYIIRICRIEVVRVTRERIIVILTYL